MKRIVVNDTGDGQSIPDWIRDALPHCTFSGDGPPEVKGTPEHPHYLGVLGQAALRTYPEETEVVCQRVFDEKGTPVEDKEWYFDYLKSTGPYLDFGAGGNSDENDRDEDVDYPQRIMPFSNVIGSHNKRGKPSFFSGDGKKIQCCLVGERVWVHGPGGWVLVSGTSFSSPKASGVCAYELDVPVLNRSWGAADMDMLSDEDLTNAWRGWVDRFEDAIGKTGKEEAWNNFVLQHAEVPEGWSKGERHDKWGRGSLEEQWQSHVRENVPQEILPPTGPTTGQRIKLLDMKRIA